MHDSQEKFLKINEVPGSELREKSGNPGNGMY